MTPRYARVADALADEIGRRRYPVGGLLPTEYELANAYGVSRHTVREALRRLVEQGLVSRRQGIGTRVETQRPSRATVHSVASLDDLLRYARETRLREPEIHDVRADARLAARLGGRAGRQWLRVRGPRVSTRGSAPPVCWTEVYIDSSFSRIRDRIPRHRGAIYTLLEREFGVAVAEIRQEISACILRGEVARHLRVRSGSAALQVARWYADAEASVLMVALNRHPAARFTHTTTLHCRPL